MSSRSLPQDVQRSLVVARDEQVARVVAMVDGLADRGPADTLIAPLRPRLAALQIRRPLRFSRLLFLPLDPLIVPASAWRPGLGLVPRTAITPVAALVRSLGVAPEIEALIAGCVAGDLRVENTAGGKLWPGAAAALRSRLAHPIQRTEDWSVL